MATVAFCPPESLPQLSFSLIQRRRYAREKIDVAKFRYDYDWAAVQDMPSI